MSKTITANSPEVQAWLSKISAMEVEHTTKNFSNLSPGSFEIQEGSCFIRVISIGRGSRSAYAFIAKKDNTTKALGTVKCGDILRPATWKAPAKHARGNIYDEHGGMASMTPYGPAYL